MSVQVTVRNEGLHYRTVVVEGTFWTVENGYLTVYDAYEDDKKTLTVAPGQWIDASFTTPDSSA